MHAFKHSTAPSTLHAGLWCALVAQKDLFGGPEVELMLNRIYLCVYKHGYVSRS